MSAQLNTFDWIAPHYDSLKGVVFGKAIYKSQAHFIDDVPRNSNVLVLGGGSGEILSLLRKTHPDCHIWFIEASREMLKIAAKRISPDGERFVTLIHGTENSLPPGILFDVAITNFFLDLFPDRRLSSVCRMICSKLRPESIWLVTDFVDGKKWWQRMLLSSMYRFFTTTCGIEAKALPSWENELRSSGLTEIDFEMFYGGFIKSAAYIKDV